MSHPQPVPPKPKKKHRGLKITGAVVGFLALVAVVSAIAANGTTAVPESVAPSTGLTSVCPEPKGAPTPPADGSSVAWDPYTCEWAKIPGTADVVSVVPSTPAAPEFPPRVEQARSKAQDYLGVMGFSHDGLVSQLAFDQFSQADAKQAVDSLNVDWNAQAATKAESYLSTMPFSCSGLVSQLKFDKFTKAQATFGAHQTTACQ